MVTELVYQISMLVVYCEKRKSKICRNVGIRTSHFGDTWFRYAECKDDTDRIKHCTGMERETEGTPRETWRDEDMRSFALCREDNKGLEQVQDENVITNSVQHGNGVCIVCSVRTSSETNCESSDNLYSRVFIINAKTHKKA